MGPTGRMISPLSPTWGLTLAEAKPVLAAPPAGDRRRESQIIHVCPDSCPSYQTSVYPLRCCSRGSAAPYPPKAGFPWDNLSSADWIIFASSLPAGTFVSNVLQ